MSPDPRSLGQMSGGRRDGQKVRDNHIFSVNRINEIRDQTRTLAREVQAFTAHVSVAPFLNPQPLAARSA
jgi:hypothetical protein